MISEKTIERYLVDRVKALGGFCYKFVSPGNNGVPDRIILLPGGRICFCEVKREDGRLSSLQKIQLDRLDKLDFATAVVYSKADVDLILDAFDTFSRCSYEV